jgi:hypothetical protein
MIFPITVPTPDQVRGRLFRYHALVVRTLHKIPFGSGRVYHGRMQELTTRRLRRGAFRSIADLPAAIDRFLAEIGEHPKPFAWTAGSRSRPRHAIESGNQVSGSNR